MKDLAQRQIQPCNCHALLRYLEVLPDSLL
jgi:hypothetical protein